MKEAAKKYYIGIDIGGMTVKGIIMERDGSPLAQGSIATGSKDGGNAMCINIAALISKMADESKINLSEAVGVGVGCPGLIDSKNGTIVFAGNLGLENFPLGKAISNKVGLPVKVTNDANAAALGEAKFGAGKEYSDSILVTLGTGVGGGVVIGGKLFEGNESKGAELGHSVIVVNGQQCGCGRRGCFEAYSSATALIRETKEAMLRDRGSKMWDFVGGDIDKVDGKTAFETEKQGDATAKLVVNNYVLYLSEGLLNLCNIFRPEAIMLGGGVCAQGDNLLNRLKVRMQALHYGYQGTPAVDLLIASLGNDAGIIGAAALLMN